MLCAPTEDFHRVATQQNMVGSLMCLISKAKEPNFSRVVDYGFDLFLVPQAHLRFRLDSFVIRYLFS